MEGMTIPRRRLLAGMFCAGILAGIAKTGWDARQGTLDAELLAAIQREDARAAIQALKEGANANAAIRVGRAGSPAFLLYDIRALLSGRHPPQTSYFAPALYLAYVHDRAADSFRNSGGIRDTSPPRRIFRVTARAFDTAPQRPEQAALVSALLQHGADPNSYPGPAGPLEFAVRMGHDTEARLLLEHGADPNAGSNTLSLPLNYADAVCAELLIRHGANVNLRGPFGQTPLMAAAMDASSSGPEKLGMLLQHGADIGASDRYGQTALMHAINAANARVLLDHGAKIDARCHSGATALMMACAHIRDPGLPRLLVQRGASVSAVDNAGKRARDYAATYARGPLSANICRFLDSAEAAERKLVLKPIR